MFKEWSWPIVLMLSMGLLLCGCPSGDDDDATDDDDAADDDATSDDDDATGDDDDATGDDDDDVTDDDDDATGDDDTEEPMVIPGASGITCEDTEPNDCVLDDTAAAWDECRQDCIGMISGDGLADHITGTLDPIVMETWDGDNDTYFFVTGGDGYVNGVMDWTYVGGDQDWYLICSFEDKNNPLDWYVMMDSTVDLTQPEQGTSMVPLPMGTLCYAWVVGYLADDGEPYTLDLWITPA